MDEATWNECREPQAMLRFLLEREVSRRKLRLWTCACVRRASHLLVKRPSWASVEVAEAFADGETGCDLESYKQAGKEVAANLNDWPQCRAARAAAEAATDDWRIRDSFYPIHRSRQEALAYAGEVAERVASAVGLDTSESDRATAHEKEKRAQAFLLRDIFAYPLCPLPPLPPGWPVDTAVRLAAASYEERELPSGHLDPQRLGILADAAEDAAVPREVLTHLRSPGPHYRGMWSLDFLLSKE